MQKNKRVPTKEELERKLGYFQYLPILIPITYIILGSGTEAWINTIVEAIVHLASYIGIDFNHPFIFSKTPNMSPTFMRNVAVIANRALYYLICLYSHFFISIILYIKYHSIQGSLEWFIKLITQNQN